MSTLEIPASLALVLVIVNLALCISMGRQPQPARPMALPVAAMTTKVDLQASCGLPAHAANPRGAAGAC